MPARFRMRPGSLSWRSIGQPKHGDTTTNGGATLRYKGVRLVYWWRVPGTKDVCHMNVQTGQARHQTFWEALALLLSMITWKRCFESGPRLMVGDHAPALQHTLDLKGRAPLMAISGNRHGDRPDADGIMTWNTCLQNTTKHHMLCPGWQH